MPSQAIPSAASPRPWTSLTPAEPVRAPFSGNGNQYILALTAYGDGFVAVGEDLSFDGPVDGAIWSSRDGIDWTRLPTEPSVLGDAAVESVAAWGSRLVAIGVPRINGNAPDGTAAIVWISDDGRHWQRIGDEDGPFGAVRIGGVTGSASGFVAWGSDDRDGVVFQSPDGTSWTAIDSGDLFHEAAIRAVARSGEGFVAVGAHLPPPDNGVVGPDLSTPAAWWSADGAAWQAASVDPGGNGRVSGLGSVLAGSAGLIALGGGGCRGCIRPAALWRSTDGRWWVHVGDDFPGWPMYASDGSRIVRDDWQASGDVSESFDGTGWRRIGNHRRVDQYGVTVGTHGIVITESFDKGGPPDENDAGVWFLAAG
jgi:hypothetical protein